MSRTLKGSLVVCVVAAATAVVGMEARAAATMINASPRAEKVNAAAARKAATPAAQSVMQREKWVGSRAIIFDQTTKSLRKPSENEVAQMVDSLRKLTSKPKSFLTPRVQSTGVRQAVLEGELANVIVARSTANGGAETLCVQTFEEAAEFLGLVKTSSKPGEN